MLCGCILVVFLKSFLENVSFEEADKKTAADKFIRDYQHAKSSNIEFVRRWIV